MGADQGPVMPLKLEEWDIQFEWNRQSIEELLQGEEVGLLRATRLIAPVKSYEWRIPHREYQRNVLHYSEEARRLDPELAGQDEKWKRTIYLLWVQDKLREDAIQARE